MGSFLFSLCNNDFGIWTSYPVLPCKSMSSVGRAENTGKLCSKHSRPVSPMYITGAGVLAYIAPKNLKQKQIKARYNIKETENQKRQNIIPIFSLPLKTEKLNCLWSKEGRQDTFGRGRNEIADHSLKH